jgi:hypothetical protein
MLLTVSLLAAPPLVWADAASDAKVMRAVHAEMYKGSRFSSTRASMCAAPAY